MPKVNLSGMTFEALIDLRKQVDEMLLKRPAEISWSVRRNLGRSWRKTWLACCCDQGWKEARRFPDRQVSAKGAEKAQVEALTLASTQIW